MGLTLKEIKRRAVRIFKTKSQAIDYISKFGFRPNEALQISRCKGQWIVMYINHGKIEAEENDKVN